ncbi:MAG: MBL fold metallo-hydrolase [Waddliaceae bacterium]
MDGTFTMLGTGGSLGIPVVGCSCPVCLSHHPHDQRLRPSAMIEIDGKRIVIDTGPDFREQALHFNIDRLDGVIYTHAHNDHTAGLDDLRAYYIFDQRSIPCLLSQETADDLKTRYAYVFKQQDPKKLLSKVTFQILPEERGECEFLGLTFGYLSYEQAGMRVNGFRFGNLAYLTDLKYYPETVFDDLKGVKTLIISALRHEPSPFHLSIKEAIAFAEQVGAEKTFFNHIGHELPHAETNATLPSHISLSYDRLKIPFTI